MQGSQRQKVEHYQGHSGAPTNKHNRPGAQNSTTAPPQPLRSERSSVLFRVWKALLRAFSPHPKKAGDQEAPLDVDSQQNESEHHIPFKKWGELGPVLKKWATPKVDETPVSIENYDSLYT